MRLSLMLHSERGLDNISQANREVTPSPAHSLLQSISMVEARIVRITFVLPDANLSGGTRVIAMYAEHLRRRGHQVLVVSTKKKVPHLLDRIKLFLKGYGWWSSNPGPSYFDTLNVEHRVINRFRPVTDSDLPDADVVVATWWETAEWVAQLSPTKGSQGSAHPADGVELPIPAG